MHARPDACRRRRRRRQARRFSASVAAQRGSPAPARWADMRSSAHDLPSKRRSQIISAAFAAEFGRRSFN